MTTQPQSDRVLQALFAHEIAQSLSALQVTAESALEIADGHLEDVTDDDWTDLREHLASMATETEAQMYQALNLLWQVLPDFAVGLERPRLKRERVMELLDSMLPAYVLKAKRRGISIVREPESDTDDMPPVYIEVNSIRRVIHNVLANALKYSYTGSNQAHRYVRIWCQRHDREGAFWALRIQNYGIGIEQDEKGRVFDPGFRGRLAKTENVFGAGLGLSDVRASMTRHGGHVFLDSARVHGDTFVTTVTLVFPVRTSIRRFYDGAHDVVD